MMPTLDFALPMRLSGINAILILYPQKILFRAKGNIYPFQCAKPPERLVALNQLVLVDHAYHTSGGSLVITLDDNSLIAIVYAERDTHQAQLLYQALIAYLNNHGKIAGAG